MLIRATSSGHHGTVTTYLRAGEAARVLGVSLPTLYAYVSRGLVTRRSAPDGRTSLYPRDELEQLAERNRRRSVPAEPAIEISIRSSITQIDDGAVRYRGHDAAGLALTHGFEAVAELLWSGRLTTEPIGWPVGRGDLARARTAITAAGDITPVRRLAIAAMTLDRPADAPIDGPDTAPPDAPTTARRLLAIAPGLLGGTARGTVAQRLASAWRRRPGPELVAAIDRALVLLADHELATSTLAVRVAASVRTEPAHALTAGLHVVAGPLHGGAGRAVAAVLADVERLGPREAVAAVLRSGERLPGFGHAVYRTADPRLAPLLEAVHAIPAPAERHRVVDALISEAGRVIGKVPNVDVGLGALLFVGGLPDDAPLFALARLAGWAAHYDEELDERPVRYRGVARPT